MPTIRVVWGVGTGPTAMSSYDAALAEAGLCNYNLVSVSSIIPARATVEAVGTAPDLGEAGQQLTVVEARNTARAPAELAACLGWARAPAEPGLFYEHAGEHSTAVEQTVRAGLEAGQELRDWPRESPTLRSVEASIEESCWATAVVLATYGTADPIC